MSSKPRLLGISGSLRKASSNTAILTAVAEMIADFPHSRDVLGSGERQIHGFGAGGV